MDTRGSDGSLGAKSRELVPSHEASLKPFSALIGTQSLEACEGCFACWSVSQQTHSLLELCAPLSPAICKGREKPGGRSLEHLFLFFFFLLQRAPFSAAPETRASKTKTFTSHVSDSALSYLQQNSPPGPSRKSCSCLQTSSSACRWEADFSWGPGARASDTVLSPPPRHAHVPPSFLSAF